MEKGQIGKRVEKMEGLRGYPIPDVPKDDHCPKDCIYYKDQRYNAYLMMALFGRAGRWDYAKCFYYCPHRLGEPFLNKKQFLKNKGYQKAYRERQKVK